MAKIILGFQGIELTEFIDDTTKGSLLYVVKDRPQNVDKHMELLGLLVTNSLRISNDNGKFTVEVVEKESRDNVA